MRMVPVPALAPMPYTRISSMELVAFPESVTAPGAVVDAGVVEANVSALVPIAALVGPVPLAIESNVTDVAVTEQPLGAVSFTVKYFVVSSAPVLQPLAFIEFVPDAGTSVALRCRTLAVTPDVLASAAVDACAGR